MATASLPTEVLDEICDAVRRLRPSEGLKIQIDASRETEKKGRIHREWAVRIESHPKRVVQLLSAPLLDGRQGSQ